MDFGEALERVWDGARISLVGSILAPHMRTVTSALRVVGLSHDPQFQNFYRVLNRANTPRQGYWVTPGGFVDADEDPRAAAVRECEEETGLKVEIVELLDVLSAAGQPGGANIVIFFRATIVGGALTADADEAGCFGRDELPEPAFESAQVIPER